MSFHTKTIICEPSQFDIEFINWKERVEKSISSYQFIEKLILSHDGNAHYILYSINVSLPRNT